MGIILQILLVFIAGCTRMMMGGSSQFPIIASSKFLGVDNPEIEGGRKVRRWVAVVGQIFVIAPMVLYYHLTPWLIVGYPAAWYLSVFAAHGRNFTCRTFWEHIWFFGRQLHNIALFTLVARLSHATPFIELSYTFIFAAASVAIYSIYNNLLPDKDRQDGGYNWSEFCTGALRAAMTFNLL